MSETPFQSYVSAIQTLSNMYQSLVNYHGLHLMVCLHHLIGELSIITPWKRGLLEILRCSPQMWPFMSIQGSADSLSWAACNLTVQKCHSDDPNHVAVTCPQSCRRLCTRGHPCNKQCEDSCGDCQFPIADVELPCGHRRPSVPWFVY